MKNLSIRIQNIAPSLTVAVDSLAKKLKAEGKDIVSLGAGEPDWDTPEEICEAAKSAIDEKKTRYTAPQGILSVREAVAKKLKNENGLDYAPEQIILTSGAKHAVFNSLLALINPGDEVIIPEPYWVTYPELVKLLGGIPVIVHTKAEDDFQMSPQELEAAITAKTKAVILNNPTNPTGTLYTENVLGEIAKLIVKHDLYAVSDEIYEHFSYSESFHFKSLAAFPQMAERTLIINGLSKSHCMTGWRIGYVAAPKEIAKLIAKAQGQTTHHPSNIAQYAAEKALQMPLNNVYKMRDEFKRRRDFLFQKISAIPGVSARLPQGAFYLFANVSALFGKKSPDGKVISDSVTFCTYLLEKEGLAIVPGSAFGREGYVRFSYAASMETLAAAAERFAKGIAQLQ
ncbi:MAG: pyridoxal phosphate-dependent aminotransferase [Hallerella porci]|uniref:Aspartate aminotransferase n=1 Tax=Hallerella porci TaxID=1945871 RepID=A0ABX5LPV3_9BACT|nr:MULTISPECIES: pyridoxal phosphate-dependent aminotransferase [Hallerella]MCI5600527.1 pyridoxal phosphate-dependent aminotransferase [Hallerella sp.]MDY3922132.1 pyridoxal phosphate-dependent aminotransferase [Hallerella porci]PWL03293.1 aspartate aminotransferase [Hallerella porci]